MPQPTVAPVKLTVAGEFMHTTGVPVDALPPAGVPEHDAGVTVTVRVVTQPVPIE